MNLIFWFKLPLDKQLSKLEALAALTSNRLYVNRKINIFKAHHRSFLLAI